MSFASGASRREFLKALAAIGAGAIAPANGLLAQGPLPPARGSLRRIDVHHHMLPPFYMKLRQMPTRDWTPEQAIQAMDKHGIATAITSTMLLTENDPLIDGTEKARGVAREINEFGARMVRDYPARFGLFAALPWTDSEGTLREIEYAYDVLKTDGIGLWTSYGDKWLGDPIFAPAFEELNRRKAVVFCHATASNCCRSLFPGASPTRAEYDFDTTRTVESLLINGTLARFPDVRIIFCHSGGTLPVMAGRINDRFPKDRPELAPKGVLYEVKKLYYEVAHATYPAPLSALMKLAPTSQILFGTDYPPEPMETTINPLAQAGLSAQTLQAINRGNAERLFPRLKA